MTISITDLLANKLILALNALISGGTVVSTPNAAGGYLYLYSSGGVAVPANAGIAVPVGQKLAKIGASLGTVGGTFLAPTAPASNLTITTTETWASPADATTKTGTPAFYRFCIGADDGTAVDTSGTTYLRIQGLVGTVAGPTIDLVVPIGGTLLNTSFPIGTFQYNAPQAA